MEAQTVLKRDVGVGVSDEIVVDRVEACLVGQGGLRLVVHAVDARVGECDERVGNHVAREVHTGRVGLYYGGMSVEIHDQAGEEVAFAVHEAEGIVVVALQPQCAAQSPGVGEA